MTYEDELLDRWQHPRFKGTLDNCTHTGEEDNSLCGDSIQYQLTIDERGIVRGIKFTGEACVLTSALADILAEKVLGLHQNLISNIKMQEFVPGVQVGFNRRKCIELPKLALLKALTNGQAQAQGN
jgi:NifU-like protein involved in Fe-S cluster formation